MPQYYTVDTKNPFEGFAADAGSSESEEGDGGRILSKDKAPSVAAANAAAAAIVSGIEVQAPAATAGGPKRGRRKAENGTAAPEGQRSSRRSGPGGQPEAGGEEGNGVDSRSPAARRGRNAVGRAPRVPSAAAAAQPPSPGSPLADTQAWPVDNDEARETEANERQAPRRPTGTRPGGARGRASVRGGRQGADYDPKHRDFDRRSGTGRGKEIKKEGGGAYAWGNEAEDFGATNAAPSKIEGQTVVAPSGESEPGSDVDKVAAAPATTEEQQPPVAGGPAGITLTAYRNRQAERRADMPDIAPVHEVPKADQETMKLEKEGYVMYRKSSDEVIAKDSRQPSGAAATAKKPSKVVVVEQLGGEFGGRGGSRGGRGGRNGGPPRPASGNASAPDRTTTRQPSSKQEEAPAPVLATTQQPPRKAINLTDSDAFPKLASS